MECISDLLHLTLKKKFSVNSTNAARLALSAYYEIVNDLTPKEKLYFQSVKLAATNITKNFDETKSSFSDTTLIIIREMSHAYAELKMRACLNYKDLILGHKYGNDSIEFYYANIIYQISFLNQLGLIDHPTQMEFRRIASNLSKGGVSELPPIFQSLYHQLLISSPAEKVNPRLGKDILKKLEYLDGYLGIYATRYKRVTQESSELSTIDFELMMLLDAVTRGYLNSMGATSYSILHGIKIALYEDGREDCVESVDRAIQYLKEVDLRNKQESVEAVIELAEIYANIKSSSSIDKPVTYIRSKIEILAQVGLIGDKDRGFLMNLTLEKLGGEKYMTLEEQKLYYTASQYRSKNIKSSKLIRNSFSEDFNNIKKHNLRFD